MFKFLLSVLLIVGIDKTRAVGKKSPFVTWDQGKAEGLWYVSRGGNQYAGFLGIPYAGFPGRFQPTNIDDIPKWDGIRNATVPGQMCAQRNIIKNTIVGSENCFVLNVYSRKLNGKAPVMVYIHGGGFNWGTSHIHGAKYLMDEDVVLVTVNYRVGAFGFLSTGDEEIQGNLGLKDQVTALKWVQKYIKNFGGDPDTVTIFGESAGASAVSLLVLSPMAKGLFHRAISQSGAALCYWSCIKNPKTLALELGTALGCDTSSSKALHQCLITRSASDILHHDYAKWGPEPPTSLLPVIEKLRPGQTESDVFLSKSPYEILTTGSYNQVPWIVGVNKEEGAYLHTYPLLSKPDLIHDLNTKFAQVAPITLYYNEEGNVPKSELGTIATSIKTFYFNDHSIGNETIQALTDLYSDRYFVHGVYRTAIHQAQHSPVYLYLFNFTGSFSFLKERGFLNTLGVTHKDDLQYLFNGISIAPEPKPGAELEVSHYLVRNWAHFAKTGRPLDSKWTHVPIEEAEGKKPLEWFSIDTTPAKISDPFTLRNGFWDKLMEQYSTTSFPLPLLPPDHDVILT